MISLNFGGAGVKIGQSFIEKGAQEHSIGADGYFKVDEDLARSSDMNNYVHFRENSLGKWTPRSILVDCESD